MPPEDRPVADLSALAQPGVPFWAMQLSAEVAAIRALVGSIPKIEKELDELRSNVVPMSEHKRLMDRSDILWDDRSNWQGAIKGLKTAATVLAGIQGVVLIGLALIQAGVSLHFGSK